MELVVIINNTYKKELLYNVFIDIQYFYIEIFLLKSDTCVYYIYMF